MLLHYVQATIHHHRAEISDLHVKLIHERHNAEKQATISEQLDGQLRDAIKDLKV